MKSDAPSGNSVAEGGTGARAEEGSVIDHPLIEEQQMLERYLLGELDERETERFEDHFLTCPRCLDQLEADERLRAGIRAVGAEHPPAHPAVGSRPWLAAAAVLLLMLPAVGFFAWRGAKLESELTRATLPRASALLLRLSPQRSGGEDAAPAHRLRLGAEPEWVVLLVELGAAPGERCHVVLTGTGGETLWSADALSTDVYGALAVSLYSPTLAAGEHRLRIELASGEVVEQRFQVVR